MTTSTLEQTEWNELADQALAGETISREEATSVLTSDDAELPALIAAAWRVRREFWGNTVQLYYLRNAKSGLCPEDCKYCSQSVVSEAAIPKYVFQNAEKLLEGARAARETGARTYCIVASGRGPTNREVEHVAGAVERIKAETGMHICACLGLLKPEQADRLKAAGVDRINHNLNTSRRHHAEIVTTHTYDDRLGTLKTCREAGLELCAGLIVGMGEKPDDIVDVGLELRDLECESIPVNFLHPIEGTPLGDETRSSGGRSSMRIPEEVPSNGDDLTPATRPLGPNGDATGGRSPTTMQENSGVLDGDLTPATRSPEPLNPRYCLKSLCLMRFLNPASEIRIAGGREVNLRSLQPLGLYPANSIFVSDYLTTPGQEPSEDYRMLEDLGFEVVLR